MPETKQTQEGPTFLPVFRGYTLDKRLREFRKVHGHHGLIEFIPWDTDREDRLLCAYIRATKDVEGINL